MKKITTILAGLFCLALLAAPVKATDYTVAASSYPVTEVAFMAVQIAGGAAVEQVYITAADTTTAQTVSIYKECASTTTVTLVWQGFIPAGGPSNAIPLNFPLFNTPMYIANACFRKSDAASVVRFNVHYR